MNHRMKIWKETKQTIDKQQGASKIVKHVTDTRCSTDSRTARIIHRRCSVRKGVLKNFAKFTEKHLCQTLLLNKVALKRLWHRRFPVNFATFLRAHFLQNSSVWLLLHCILTAKWHSVKYAIEFTFSDVKILCTETRKNSEICK